MDAPDWLHMSPPCINASIANQDAGEAPEDIAMAKGCINAIRRFMSPFVSLENVWQYRNFESFQLIYAELIRLNYQVRFWHLCAADYGVAQTRKRLILVASLKQTPRRPSQTHTKEPEPGFFGSLPRWIGWYEAIEDLIPALPTSQFANWQLKRLGDQGTQLVGGGNTNVEIVDSKSRKPDEPMFTVSTHSPGNSKAFLAAVQGEASDKVDAHEPAPTTTTAHGEGKYRAFLVGKAEQANCIRQMNPRGMTEPSPTITADDFRRPVNVPKAFIHPYTTGDGTAQPRESDDPMFTVTAEVNRNLPKAWLSEGVVVAMTVRALARFQSIPDTYALPENNRLACRVVGNAVPPLLMQRVIEAQI